MRRGSLSVLVTRPKFGSSMFVLPGLNLTRLKTLKASARRSSLLDSLKRIVFASEKFSLYWGGVRTFGLVLVALPRRSLGCAGKNERGTK